ncbi:MAG TPA: c-type cytochrome [Terracidiphilus sp.]|nr:c-type cytochrome [Terracidiphilus sp.]
MKLLLNTNKSLSTVILAAAAWLGANLAARSPMDIVHAATAGQESGAQATSAASPEDSAAHAGAQVYAEHCSMCHGKNREGNPPTYPSLAGIKHQLSDEQIATLIHNGKGGMPPFPALPQNEVAGLLEFLGTSPNGAAQPAPHSSMLARKGIQISPEAAAGGALFQQNCAFCHGRDAMGGETGPDLTRSKLVLTDSDGSKIAQVVSEGRTSGDKKMPAFQFSSSQIQALVAFIRARVVAADAMKGGRRGVDVSDLQTGNAEQGKQYFYGAGGCAKCHSPTGDLAGVASRYEGLQLEERMLYPRGAKSTVTVTLSDGQKITGTLAYHDEFTIALTDHTGTYKSWPTGSVKYSIDSPVNAHVEMFSRYTDDDIHNLMAYIQTLR